MERFPKYSARKPARPLPARPGGQLVTKKQVRDMLRSQQQKSEIKSKDYSAINLSSTSPIMTQISSISVGTSISTRIGDQVRINHLNIRYLITLADTTNVVRLIFFQWKIDNTTAPTDSDIYAVTGSQETTSQYNHYAEETNMKVLWDSGALLLSTNRPQISGVLNFTNTLLSLLTYNAGSSSTGLNQIYYCFTTDSVAAPSPNLQMDTRVYFTDD